MRLPLKHRIRLQARYRTAIALYGDSHSALLWNNKAAQQCRFEQIEKILKRETKFSAIEMNSLLDVGCGFGDLKSYLKDHGLEPLYTGIDLSQEMVLSARIKHPEIHVKQGELSEINWQGITFDWVVASGTLNESVGDEGEHAKSLIQKMYAIANKGIIFNCLNQQYEPIAKQKKLQSFDPKEIKQFCREFCHEVEIIQNYLAEDFTVFCRK